VGPSASGVHFADGGTFHPRGEPTTKGQPTYRQSLVAVPESFWLACFGQMTLAEAMGWLDQDDVVIP
jgi:hypothetical protein